MIQNTLYQHAIWNLEPLFHWFIIIYYVWNASGNFEQILNGNGIFHKIALGNGIRPPLLPPSGPSYYLLSYSECFRTKEIETWIKFNPGLELIGLRTTGPWIWTAIQWKQELQRALKNFSVYYSRISANSHFFSSRRTKNPLTLFKTFVQRPLSFVPKVAFVERFNRSFFTC